MDHDEARELLEIAAVEPSGYVRLAAGDTPESAALAAHLAGCPDCTVEFERLGSLAGALRTAVRSMPPPELRDRTLALVHSTGRPRSDVASATAAAEAAALAAPTPLAPTPSPAVPSTGRAPEQVGAVQGDRRRWDRTPWLALAAAIVIAVIATGGWWRAASDLGTAEAAAESLEHATVVAVEVAAAPDARVVGLAPPDQPATDPAPSGHLVYSARDAELVVMTEGLTPLEPGWSYHCWVEDAVGRRDLGPMTVAGEVVYWVGWSSSMDGAASDARFGVSRVPAGSTSGGSVLEGP